MKQHDNHNKHDKANRTHRTARLLSRAGAGIALAAAVALSLHAGAARTVSVSPQGTVTEVRQAVVNSTSRWSHSVRHPRRIPRA